MSRADIAQAAPAPDVDLSGFPAEAVISAIRAYRAHSVDHGPWYFSNDGQGRFDLFGI